MIKKGFEADNNEETPNLKEIADKPLKTDIIQGVIPFSEASIPSPIACLSLDLYPMLPFVYFLWEEDINFRVTVVLFVGFAFQDVQRVPL